MLPCQKENIFFNLEFKNEATRASLRVNTRTLILGDLGATSPGRCDIFGRKFTSRAELILTEPVPEVVKLFPADWAEKYFSAQSAMRSSRNSVAFLHQDGQTYERVKRLRTPENGRRESRWMYTH